MTLQNEAPIDGAQPPVSFFLPNDPDTAPGPPPPITPAPAQVPPVADILAMLRANPYIVDSWQAMMGDYQTHPPETIARHIFDHPQLHGLLSVVSSSISAAGAEKEAPTAAALAVQLILEKYADRLAVVDRNKLFLRREGGTWIDATRPNPAATAALQNMIRRLGTVESWSQRQTDGLRTALFYILENPASHGVRSLRIDDFDRVPIFALKDGGSIDARTLEILDSDATAKHLLLDRDGSGLDFRPELLSADATHPGMRLALHFEPDRLKPSYAILKRLAFMLLQPRKAVDSVIMPTSDSGKTTLAAWVCLALSGYALTADAINILSSQGTRFTSLQRRLAKFKLVFLDEADKLRAPLVAGDLNTLTADWLTVEEKGADSYEVPRRGNSIFLGAAPPSVELGQGGRERLAWAFDGSHVAKMPAELRELIHDPEAQAWLATNLLKLASQSHENGYDAADGDSRAAAAAVHLAASDPLQTAVGDCVEPFAGSFLPNAELKGRLDLGYPNIPSDVSPKALAKAMQAAFGVSPIGTTRGGQSVRGYPGLRLK